MPEQRRVIDAQLEASKDDVKKGRVHGPFETHEAMMTFLHDQMKKARSKKNTPKRKAR
jgi:hypothetical protein